MSQKPLLFLGAALATLAPATQAFAGGSEEAQKQATRLIAQAISSRVGTTDLGDRESGDMSGSAVWALGGVTALEFDAGGLGDFDGAFGLGSVGWDKGNGNTLFGVAFSANYGVFDAGGTDTDAFGISITPYGAVKVNDNFFFSGLVGFGAAFNDDGTNTFTNSSINGEIAANLVARTDASRWTGKLAYQGTFSMPDGADEEYFDSVSLFGEGEFNMGETAAWFVNAEVVYSLDDTSDADTPVYVGTGLNFHSSPSSEWGIGYSTALNAGDLSINTLTVRGRWTF